MALKTVSAKAAAALDRELMSTGAFSIDQLMELAGLSVSQVGFSFSGEVREPFPVVIQALEETKLPVTSVDAPSSWDIETGPPRSGLGSKFSPTYLVSLTAPKPLVQHFEGRHFVGGRFLSPAMAKKYDLEIPNYQGIDQFVEVCAGSARKLPPSG
ncbi:putative protein [Rosellinia necatrix]|uniref:NAD(P)H-hydrate epimerase n=1 Tax=Rosellinia necatrix TaxID=77044 RepID=A0A1W2TF75_ROSNE|nr:putative protein [Rosellinia necatrix]